MLVLGGVMVVALPTLVLLIGGRDPGSTNAGAVVPAGLPGQHRSSPVLIFLNDHDPTPSASRGTAVWWNTRFMIGDLPPTFVNFLSPGCRTSRAGWTALPRRSRRLPRRFRPEPGDGGPARSDPHDDTEAGTPPVPVHLSS
jgi:hypothetical protein